MKTVHIRAALCFALLSCSCASLGGGQVVRETRPVEPFTRVDLRVAADVELKVGAPEPRLEVRASEHLLEHLRTHVVDGVLTVDLEPGSYSYRRAPRIIAHVPALEGVVIVGSSNAQVKGLDGGHFQGTLRGSGELSLAGRVEQLDLVVWGSGNVSAYGLEARSARVRMGGSGSIAVHATLALDAELSGSGQLRYRGRPPTLVTRGNGTSSIRGL